MDRGQLDILIRRYLRDELTQEELRLFVSLIEQDEYREIFLQHIGQALQAGSTDASMDPETEERILDGILHADVPPPAVRNLRMRPHLMRYAMAASLVGVILAAAYFISTGLQSPGDPAPRAVSTIKRVPRIPAEDKVTLTLADGTVILLDELKDGAIATGTGAPVKRRGTVDYRKTVNEGRADLYNTISTPRGGRYRIVLSDGTSVWLNAASSIRFPVVFGEDERRVEITGQAYLEVAPMKAKPFRVHVRDAEVEVLGTHFDVMAYPDEGRIVTTLLEGAVRFSRRAEQALLSPGQQSISGTEARIRIAEGVDVSKVVAWKDGFIEFNGADIGTVCRSLSRSYDIEIEYDERIRESFYAKFPLGSRISVVLKALEMTGKVRFDNRDGKLHARP